MEFLYRLYSNDYFGIGLFIAITILAFSFLVILFFGKKDEKARNQENENIETNNIETIDKNVPEDLQAESLESMSLTLEAEPIAEMTETKEEIPVEEPAEVNPFAYSNMVLNSELVEENETQEIQEPIIESVQEVNVTTENDIFGSNFTEELAELNLDTTEEKVEEEQKEFDIDPFNMEPPIVEKKENNIFSEPAVEKEVAPKKVVMPTQFSSVYLTKEKVEPKEEVVEEEPEITPIPLKPDFDLPKPLDLPKLNTESGVTSSINENIFNTNSNENLNNIFENIEEDSYTINK